MTNPTWFNKAQYLDSKLAQLIASGDTRFSDIVALDSAIEAAGYTAYSHFQAFSLVERTSPNSYFNAAEYLEAKAAQANATKVGGKADWNSSTIALAIKDAGFATIWDHFTQFGWKEGVNPSNAFDVSSYFDAKLAQLQKAEPTANWTMATMKAAFEKAGIDPVTHALTYGAAEGVKPVTVPVAEQVSASPVSPNVGKTYALTTGVDNVVGTSGNDTVNATVDGADKSTLSSLDAIDGGAGADTLNILQVKTNSASGLVIKNVENAVIRSADGAVYNTTAWAGLTSLKLTQAGGADLTAAATTAVDVSGATGAVIVNGGSTVAVAAEAGSIVTVGGTTGSAGAVSVTQAKMGTAAIQIDGGTDVTVTAAGSSGGSVKIGTVTATTPTGKVAVTVAGAAVNGDAAQTTAAIAVKGGSSVTVTQSVTADADVATKSNAALIKQGDVALTGTSVTTSVTVNQTEANAGKTAVKAVAGVNQVDAITFIALAKTESVTVGGLTFTASKDLTAVEVAAAFSNLSAGVTQGAAPAGNGIYTGTFGAAYTTGSAVTANSVTTLNATATQAGPAKVIGFADTAAKADLAAAVKTAGVAATPAVTGALNIAGGMVAIDGNIAGDDVLSTVSLNGFGAGSTIKSDALSALNLSNSAQGLTVTNGAASTLALALDNVKGSAVTLGDAYTALNITTAGKSSAATLTANKVTALTVVGDQAADLTGSSFTALKTVTVTGSAGLTVNASGATVTAVDTTATTGNVNASIDASKATYTGGAGIDQVTLTTATVSKAISTGAGDDLVRLAPGTATLGANVSAGEGAADTLEMAVADAVTASGATTFEAKMDGFEKLALQASAAKSSVDLANLDDISYVVNYGSTDLTLTKMANNGTLELINNSTKTTVEMTDAKAATDSFNILVNNSATKSATLAVGEVVVHKVETVNIVSNVATAKSDNTLTLSADAVKAVVVTGNGALNLTAADATLTSVNASALSSVFTFSSAVKGATVTGGSDNDMLTAAGNEQTLVGGAGNDTLTVTGDLATLTGGAGKDTFAIGDATSNVNSYATITDLAAGDVIKFGASASNFAAAKVKLGDTAVFQDFANNAIATTNLGDVSWFQVGGNTYAVQNVSDTTSFLNGTDVVVRITGLVDLSTASFSSDFDTLLIA